MTEEKLNQLLAGFTGDDKHDIEYYLSLTEEYEDDPDSITIHNAALQKLYSCLSSDTKEKFINGMREKGLDYLLVPKEVEFHSLSRDDIVKLKKFLLGDTAGITQTKLNFEKAVLVGQPLAMSVPQEIVDRLKKQRKEWIEKDVTSE